jgi:hypothetical protein
MSNGNQQKKQKNNDYFLAICQKKTLKLTRDTSNIKAYYVHHNLYKFR